MLIVVDMQKGFLNEHSSTVIPNVVALIERCSRKNIPAVFTKFRNLPESPYERLMNWTNVRESPETDLHEAFTDWADIVIEKNFYTAFTAEFSLLVETAAWETIVVCGVSTESCVLKTAIDAFELGFTPIVLADACASDLGNDMHNNGLSVIEILIGKDQVMNMEEFISKFLSTKQN